jgi:signal transduction histidine kinase
MAKRGSILAVEDTEANLHLLTRLLGTSGYEVHGAHNGPAALAMVKEVLPDLILLDIEMAGMNGYEVCRQLKADEKTCNIPIIFISALVDTDEIVKGFDLGGVDYITKPFKIKEVIARVANQLTLVEQRKQIEKMREKDRLYFESLDNMKNEFIRMATHDLRSPLNIVLGYAGLLNEVDVSEEDGKLLQQATHGIQDSVQKMMVLVTDMLDLAQMESNVSLALIHVFLTEFLEKCLKGFTIMAEEKQITMTFYPPDEDIILQIDPFRMERVIANLVSNAIKYTPEGGTVDISAYAVEDNHVVIQVEDTGLGIPEKDLPHLFDTFFRVNLESHRKMPGTGLGLTIVKTLVEQHGGRVYVESELGKGSIFTVLLTLPDEPSPN